MMIDFFKSIRVYEFTEGWLFEFSADEVSKGLAKKASRHPTEQERIHIGFCPVFDDCPDLLYRDAAGRLLFRVAFAEKVIPTSAVSDEVAARMAASEKELDEVELSGLVLREFLAKALVQTKRYHGYIDQPNGRVVMGVSSEGAANLMQRALRGAIGSLGIVSPEPPSDLGTQMTQWVVGKASPPPTAEWALGDFCELNDEGVRVTSKGQYVGDRSVTSHIEDGMEVSKVQLVGRGLSFVLSDVMQITGIKPHPTLVNQMEDSENPGDSFRIMANEIHTILEGVRSLQPAMDAEGEG